MNMQMQAGFSVVYAPDLAQYVVERGEMRVVPTARKLIDTDARLRATDLCAALNRVYAPPAEFALAHYEDGAPRYGWSAPTNAPDDPAQAARRRGADFAQPDMPDLPDIANDVCGWCGSDATECDCEERYI